ncbi:hypothetical protein [Aureimonas sp. N4]|uniref:hypothetical protein n=1 Tax=Aureimonas sp. N4 TaxID=1638165 RepID=UPI000781EE14|nr:hypothetical protein [Aureimonas sp. N4]
MKIEVTLPPSAAGDLADVMSTYGLSLDDAVALLIVAGAAELTPGYVERLLGDVVRRDRT